MSQPHDTTIAPSGARPKWTRSSRGWNVPWFSLSRWAFGIFGPSVCFGLAVTRLEHVSPMLGPRSGMLAFAAVCVLAQLVSTLRPARGDGLSAALAGALRAGGIVGVLYSMMLTPLAVGFFVISPPVGVLGLLPLAATIVLFSAARLEERSSKQLAPRAGVILFVCGFLLPIVMGWGAARTFNRVESRIVASYVDTEMPQDSSRLEQLRSIAWMHDWPQLRSIYRGDLASFGVERPTGRRERAGQAWSALTGRPPEALDPAVID